MATIGSFAGKVFSVSANNIYTFDEFSFSSELSIEEQEVDNQKASTYIKGIGLNKISFTVLLIKQKNIDVRKEIESWEKIKDSKTPNMLVINNKNMSKNRFLLTKIEASDIKFSSKGEFLSAKLKLDFCEYVRAGKKKETKT